MFCANCGVRLSNAAKYCAQCGHPTPAQAPEVATGPVSPAEPSVSSEVQRQPPETLMVHEAKLNRPSLEGIKIVPAAGQLIEPTKAVLANDGRQRTGALFADPAAAGDRQPSESALRSPMKSKSGALATCVECGAPIPADHPWARCGSCGAVIPQQIRAALSGGNTEEVQRAAAVWAAKSSEAARTRGIVLTVLGGLLGIWAFTRVTSVAGRFFTWSPPFSQYETMTLVGALVAAILLISGLIHLTKVNRSTSTTPSQVSNERRPDSAHSGPYCTGCGGRLGEQDVFCAACGRPRHDRRK